MTTGSSRQRQQGHRYAASEEPSPDGPNGNRQLYSKPRPMASAASKKMRGVRVSWDSTVSGVGSGPSTHLHDDPGTTNYAGRRSRVSSDDDPMLKSGMSNDSVVPRAQRVRDEARVPSLAQDGLRRPTTSASAASAADGDLSPRTSYSTENVRSRVRGRPWGNTGQPNRQLVPPQQHQSPTSDFYSRDQRTGTNGGITRGQHDNGNAAKPGRRTVPPRKGDRIASKLGESRGAARGWRNADTEGERLADVYGAGGAGGGDGSRTRTLRGDWGIDRRDDGGDVWAERQKTRWDADVECGQVSPTPLAKDEKVRALAGTGSASFFDGSLLELIDDLEEEERQPESPVHAPIAENNRIRSRRRPPHRSQRTSL
ncbi:unnamed protein product [Sphacelaria rigidula]